MKSRKLLSALALTLCLAMLLSGCSALKTKKFTFANDTASIKLNKDWTEKKALLDSLFMVGSEDGSESFFVLQVKKGNLLINSFEAVEKLIKKTFNIQDEQAANEIKIPGLSNVKVVDGNIDAMGGCFAYGESDYAYYAFGYMSKNWDDTSFKTFESACGTFKETPPKK